MDRNRNQPKAYGEPNGGLDLVLGLLGLIGLVIELFRRRNTEVAWWWFMGGVAITSVLTLIIGS